MKNRRAEGGSSSSSWPLLHFQGSSEAEQKLKITTVLLCSLPNSRDAESERGRQRGRVAQEVNQKGTLTWAFRWRSKVPGLFVTQLPTLLPGLEMLLLSFSIFRRKQTGR